MRKGETDGRIKLNAEDDSLVYITSLYWVITTLTTVGYGDITGNTTSELFFSMMVEFVGLTFFSFLTGTISVMFSGD